MTLLEDRVHLTIDGEEFHGTIEYTVGTFGTAYVKWDDGTADYVATEVIAQAQGYAPSSEKAEPVAIPVEGEGRPTKRELLWDVRNFVSDLEAVQPEDSREAFVLHEVWDFVEGKVQSIFAPLKEEPVSQPTREGRGGREQAREYAVDTVFHMISTRWALQWQSKDKDELKQELLDRLALADFPVPLPPTPEQSEIAEQVERVLSLNTADCNKRDIILRLFGTERFRPSQPTTTLSEEELSELERLVNAASSGPWSQGVGAYHAITVEAPDKKYPVVGSCFAEDAQFIAASRTAVPSLIAEVRRLRVENEKLKHAWTKDRNRRNHLAIRLGAIRKFVINAANSADLYGYREKIVNYIDDESWKSESIPPVIEQQEPEARADCYLDGHYTCKDCGNDHECDMEDAELAAEIHYCINKSSSVQQEQGEESFEQVPRYGIPSWMKYAGRAMNKGDLKFYLFKDTSEFDYDAGVSLPPVEEPEQNENHDVTKLIRFLDRVDEAMVREGVDASTRQRISNRLIWGFPNPELDAIDEADFYEWKHARAFEPDHKAQPNIERSYVQRGTGQLEAPCLGCSEVVLATFKPSNPDQTETLIGDMMTANIHGLSGHLDAHLDDLDLTHVHSVDWLREYFEDDEPVASDLVPEGEEKSTKRPWTDDVKNEDGSTTVTVKRACNGCGRHLGDVTDEEMERAIEGLPALDVRDECPSCSAESLHSNTSEGEEKIPYTQACLEARQWEVWWNGEWVHPGTRLLYAAPPEMVTVRRISQPVKTLREKLAEGYNEGRSRPPLTPDIAEAIFREHFDSKLRQIKDAMDVWTPPDCNIGVSKIRAILFNEGKS